MVPPSRPAQPVLTEQHRLRLVFAQDRLEDPQQGFAQLVLQVVLAVDGNTVLQHIDRVLEVL